MGLIRGVIVSVLAQAALVLAWFRADVFTDYWHALQRIPQSVRLLEPDASKRHSLAALTNVLPPSIGTPLWAIVSVFTVAAVVLI